MSFIYVDCHGRSFSARVFISSVGTLQKHAAAAIALTRTRSGQLWSHAKNFLRPEADMGP